MPGRLSLGDWADVEPQVVDWTPPDALTERRHSLRLGDWANATAPAVEAKQPQASAGKRSRALRPDALQLIVGAGVAGVVSAQGVAQAINAPTAGSGTILVLLQASGPVFVALLTVMVLRACHHLRGAPAARFWILCLASVTLTYVAWSVVYFVAAGSLPQPLPAAAGTFTRALLTGGAQVHLGLVFVAVQFCAVMPVVRWLIRVTRRVHLRLFAAVLILQLTLSAFLHWVPIVPDAANLLPSYLLFVVSGALFVAHQEELQGWIARRPEVVVTSVFAGVVAALSGYGLDLARHLSPERAAQAMTPGVTLAAMGALVVLARAGTGWERRRHPWWQLRLLSAWSDTATGVYLVTPLVMQVALALLFLAGPGDRSPRVPEALTIVLGLGCGLPLLLAASSLLTAGLRRSPLSVVLTGRPSLSPARRAGGRQRLGTAGAGIAGLAILMVVAVVVPPSPRVATAGEATTPAPEHATTTSISSVATATAATMHTIIVGTVRRRYEVIRPQHPVSKELPVLVLLHGGNTDLKTEEGRDGLLTYASAGQAILVYPAGLHESWNDGSCCGFAYRHRVDDVMFLTDVVRATGSMHGADPKAVYLGGYRAGGKMTYDVICRRPRLVAGAVVIAAVPGAACPSGPPVPLLQVAGTKDPGNRYQHVVKQVLAWVKRDRCAARASADDAYETLTLQRWSSCAHGSRVEFATYAGAGRSPLGGNGSPPLARVMMSFVERLPFTG